MPTIDNTAVNTEVAKAKAMLAQTKAQGSTPFTGSSYDTSQNTVNTLNPNLIPGPAVQTGQTPKLIVSGSSSMKQFNQQSAGIDSIISEKNTNLTGAGTGTGTAGATNTTGTGATGGAGGTSTTKEEKEVDPYAKMAADAKVASDARDKQNTDTLNAAKANLSDETQAVVDSITASYAEKVKAQEAASNMLMGIMKKQGFQGGYMMANSGQQDPAMAASMQAGVDKVSALNSERDRLIAQAKIARDKQDLALTSANFQALQKNADDLNNTILAISKQAETEKQNAITAQRNAEADIRAQQDQDIQMSTALAPTIAPYLKGLSAKDSQALIDKMATAKGIDPLLISSAIETYNMKAEGQDLIQQQRLLAIEKAQADLDKSIPDKLPTVNEAVGNVVQWFKDKMTDKKWKGINPQDYKNATDTLKKNYGGNAVLALDKEILNQGLSVDTSK